MATSASVDTHNVTGETVEQNTPLINDSDVTDGRAESQVTSHNRGRARDTREEPGKGGARQKRRGSRTPPRLDRFPGGEEGADSLGPTSRQGKGRNGSRDRSQRDSGPRDRYSPTNKYDDYWGSDRSSEWNGPSNWRDESNDYWSKIQEYGPSWDSYDYDRFGPPQGNFGPSRGYFGQFRGNIGPQQGYVGSPRGNFGPPYENFGPPRDKFGPPYGNFGPPHGNFGPSQENFGPPREKFGPLNANFGPPHGNFGPPQDNFGPPRENFGPPREYFGPPKGDFWSHRGNFGPSLRGNFGPHREHFGPPQDDCDPSRYYGSVRDDAGHSEQLGPDPRQSGSQNHGDHGMVKTHFGPPGQGFSEPSGEQNGPPDTQNRPLENSDANGGPSVHFNGQKGAENGPPDIDVFGPPDNNNVQTRFQNGSQDGPKVTTETRDYNGTHEEQNGPPPMNYFGPPDHVNGPSQGQKGNGLQYCPPWAYNESSRGNVSTHPGNQHLNVSYGWPVRGCNGPPAAPSTWGPNGPQTGSHQLWGRGGDNPRSVPDPNKCEGTQALGPRGRLTRRRTDFDDYNGAGPMIRSSSRGRDKDRTFTSLPRALSFDGTSSWQGFFSKFSSYARTQEWSKKECLEYLCWCLEGKASDFYVLHTEGPTAVDFDQLVRKFERRFGLRELPETALISFNNAKQSPDESLDGWADRVLTLASSAFKQLPEDYTSQQVIIKFCHGCLDREAGEHVANMRPSSIDEALDRVKWAIYNHKLIFGKARKDARSVGIEYEVAAVKPGGRFEERLSRLEGGLSRLDNIEKQVGLITSKLERLIDNRASPRWRSPVRQRSRSPTPDSTRCFECGKVGHFKRECPDLKPKTDANPNGDPKTGKKVSFAAESLNTNGAEQRADLRPQ